MLPLPPFLISLFILLPHQLFQVAAYSFELSSEPTQCGALTVNLTQGQGVPPYTILVSPFGPTPTTLEKRNVLSTTFSGNSATLQLTYPANSNFIIAVGDFNGIGTGGTSGILNVQSSNDDSCLPTQIRPDFTFQVISNSISQCQPAMFSWNTSLTQGTAAMQLLIQHGISETLPITPDPQSSGELAVFDWTANVPAGTLYVLVAGDDRGFGSGGTVTGTIGNSPSGDKSCLVENSPSMTPQSPPGAAVTQNPSSSSPSSPSSSSSPSTPTSPSSPSPPTSPSSPSPPSSRDSIIIGSAVGGGTAIIIFIISLLVYMRHSRHKQRQPMTASEGLESRIHQGDYRMESFIITPIANSGPGFFPPAINGDIGTSTRFSRGQYIAVPMAGSDSLDYNRGVSQPISPINGVEGSSSVGHRPITFVQHEDRDRGRIPADLGGPSVVSQQQIVELPPNYDTVGGS